MLSIVILTYNQKDFTLRCLDALTPYMEAHPDDEIVLVDNGSTDSTLSDIDNRNYSWKKQLVIVRQKENSGVAKGRNIGISKSSGDVVMILDNDTAPSRDAIEFLVNYIETNSATGLVAPKLCAPDGTVQESAKPFPGLGIKIKNVFGSRKEIIPEGNKVSHPYYVIGACQVFRRNLYDKIGPLDEKIFYGPEDADFCMRIRKAGYSIDYNPAVSIIHDYQRATTRSIFSPLARKHISALLYFWLKHRRFI